MGRTAGKRHRSRTQQADDQREIVRLYTEGWTQAAIGDRLGLSQQSISLELEKIRAVWRAEHQREWVDYLVRELARLDKLEATYWDAWERSKQDRVKRSQTFKPGQSADTKPTASEIVVETIESVGDVAFLQGVERAVALRSRLVGLLVPQAVQQNLVVVQQQADTRQRVEQWGEVLQTDEARERWRAVKALMREPE